jgi:hypothetical protein
MNNKKVRRLAVGFALRKGFGQKDCGNECNDLIHIFNVSALQSAL